MTDSPARLQMVDPIGSSLFAYRAQYDYSEGSERMMLVTQFRSFAAILAWLRSGRRVVSDCSGGYTAVCEKAGCEDPNALNFDGYGYTGTLLDHMPHIALSALELGDAVVFGAYPGDHVVFLYEKTGTNPDDWKVWSKGQESDPEIITLGAMIGYFAGRPATGLSLAPFLPAVPKSPKTMHYERYEHTIKRKVRYGRAKTELAAVKAYDAARAKSRIGLSVRISEANLRPFEQALIKVEREQDPRGIHFYRAWRRARITSRIDGNVITPTL